MALGTRRTQRRAAPAPKLQITAMMDMFTIIMIFLLVSFSSKPETMQLDRSLELPQSAAEQDYSDSLRLVLTRSELAVGEEVIATLDGDEFVGLDPQQPKNSDLYLRLRAYRERLDQPAPTPTHGAHRSGKPVLPAGKHVLFFCDKRLPFRTINQVIKTAGMAGFPNLQFAVLQK